MLLIITVLLILIFGGYFFSGSVQFFSFADLQDSIEETETNLQKKQAIILRAKEDEARYLAMKKKLEIPGSASDQQSEILKEITQIFEESGILATTKPMPYIDSRDSPFRIFQFKFSNIDSPFQSLMLLLKSMDDPSSVLEVEDMNIKNVYQKDGEWWIKADITASRLVYSGNPEQTT